MALYRGEIQIMLAVVEGSGMETLRIITRSGFDGELDKLLRRLCRLRMELGSDDVHQPCSFS